MVSGHHRSIGLADLAGGQIDPLDAVAGIINFYLLAWFKVARRDGCVTIVRELAIELLPKVGIGGDDLPGVLRTS
jgi:hypothetical protein